MLDDVQNGKITTKKRGIGVQLPCAMCGRSHFLFQNDNFSSKHLATKF